MKIYARDVTFACLCVIRMSMQYLLKLTRKECSFLILILKIDALAVVFVN